MASPLAAAKSAVMAAPIFSAFGKSSHARQMGSNGANGDAKGSPASVPPSASLKGKAAATPTDLAAQRLQDELVSILQNPIPFRKTEFRQAQPKYAAINEAPASGAGAAGEGQAAQDRANGAASSSLLTSRLVKGPLSDESYTSPRASTSARPMDPPADTTASPKKAKRDSLYPYKISYQMPNGIRSRASGLVNRGNTCFLNSTLQSLVHLPPLVHALLNNDEAALLSPIGGRGPGGFLAVKALKALADRMLRSGSANVPVVPVPFIQSIKQYAPTLRNGRQEDAHEFLRFLLEALQHSCVSGAGKNLPPNDPLRRTTFVRKLFGGRLRSRVHCLQCKHNSDTFDAMMDLSLDLPADVSTLLQAIEAFTQPDQLRGRERYKCEKCQRLVNAEKRFTIDEPPTILTIHLKRFKMTGGKITRPISYKETLTIPASCMSEGNTAVRYRLYSVVSHLGGGPHSGHYVATVKAPKGNEWLNMNDDYVSPASGPADARSAYILFYVKDASTALQDAIRAPAGGKQASSASPAAAQHRFSADDLRANGAKKRKADDGEGHEASPNGKKHRAEPNGVSASPLGSSKLQRQNAGLPLSFGKQQGTNPRSLTTATPASSFYGGGATSAPRNPLQPRSSQAAPAEDEDLGETLQEQQEVEESLLSRGGAGSEARSSAASGEYESLVPSARGGASASNGAPPPLNKKARRKLKKEALKAGALGVRRTSLNGVKGATGGAPMFRNFKGMEGSSSSSATASNSSRAESGGSSGFGELTGAFGGWSTSAPASASRSRVEHGTNGQTRQRSSSVGTALTGGSAQSRVSLAEPPKKGKVSGMKPRKSH